MDIFAWSKMTFWLPTPHFFLAGTLAVGFLLLLSEILPRPWQSEKVIILSFLANANEIPLCEPGKISWQLFSCVFCRRFLKLKSHLGFRRKKTLKCVQTQIRWLLPKNYAREGVTPWSGTAIKQVLIARKRGGCAEVNLKSKYLNSRSEKREVRENRQKCTPFCISPALQNNPLGQWSEIAKIRAEKNSGERESTKWDCDTHLLAYFPFALGVQYN